MDKLEQINNDPRYTPYVQHKGDRYFKKGWIKLKSIVGPDGRMSDGAITDEPSFKVNRGMILTNRTYVYDEGLTRSEFLPGWGTVAANLTMTNNFGQDLELILNQPETESVFWVDHSTGKIKAIHHALGRVYIY